MSVGGGDRGPALAVTLGCALGESRSSEIATDVGLVLLLAQHAH